MLMDEYLEEYDYVEIHGTRVPGPPDAPLYKLTRHLDFSSSFIIRALFFLRGMGMKKLSLDSIFAGRQFSLLEENPPNEFVIGGMAGADLKPVPIESPEHFHDFQELNGIKIAWNFMVKVAPDGGSMVTTETRVQCLGPKIKRRFSIYWFFIRPFSGLVRLEMLRVLKKNAVQSLAQDAA